MITSRERGLVQLLVFAQIFVVCLFYWSLYFLFFFLREAPLPSAQTYGKYAIIVVFAMVFEAISRPSALKLRPGRVRRIAGAVARRQTIWILAAMMMLSVFSRDLALSRGFLIFFIVLVFVLLFLFNRYAVIWSSKIGSRFLGDWRIRTVLLGPKSWCESIQPEINFSTGLLDLQKTIYTDDECFDEACGKKLVDQLAEIPVDLLVMPPRSFSPEIVIRLMRHGDRKGYRCWLPVEYTRRYGRRFSMQKVGRLDMLTPPTEPLENTSNRVMKRAFDLVFSAFVFLTVLPVACTFVWVIHRLYSPGPLFFKQDRIGKNGKVFKVYKFRSLHVDHGAEASQVTRSDDRIFKGGRFLRKSSIDEIPQFINVLKSEMSVVGPRPHMGEHDDEFEMFYECYGQRRYVKPGVTGLAQIKGFRGEVNSKFDLRHRARLDRFYVTHWDFGFDTRIVLLTVKSMIRPPKTAY